MAAGHQIQLADSPIIPIANRFIWGALGTRHKVSSCLTWKEHVHAVEGLIPRRKNGPEDGQTANLDASEVLQELQDRFVSAPLAGSTDDGGEFLHVDSSCAPSPCAS
jgi:hypothetical protein